jgi:hypothetical protein
MTQEQIPRLNEAQPGAGEIRRVTPEEVEAIKAQNAAAAGPFLHGERQLGYAPGPNGSGTRHYETPDGMKVVRNVGERYPSAAHFHVANGVGTPDEIEHVNGKAPVQPASFAGKIASKIFRRK